MLRPLQRPNRPRNRRVHVRPRPRNHPRRKRRRIKLVLRIENQRSLHRPRPQFARRLPMQQLQKMPRNRIRRARSLALHLNPLPAPRIMQPVAQHRHLTRQQSVRNRPRPFVIMPQRLRLQAPQDRNTRP